jgi:hypothetical protein
LPTYTFKNKKTGVVSEEFLSLSEREERLKDPDIEQCVSAPSIVSGRGMGKPDNTFRDILKRIKKHNRGSKVNTF